MQNSTNITGGAERELYMATAAGFSINTGLDAPYEDNQEPEKELPEKTGSEESTSSDSESEGLGEELPERKDKGRSLLMVIPQRKKNF